MGGLRGSFAAKLAVLEVGTILVVAIVLAGALIYETDAQSKDLERNVAAGAVSALQTDLNSAGGNATSLAQRIAAYAPAVDALQKRDQPALSRLLAAEALQLPVGDTLVVLDDQGRTLVVAPGGSPAEPVLDLRRWEGIPVLTQAVQGSARGDGTLETVSGELELDGVAVATRRGVVVGFVLDSIPVQKLLQRLGRPGGGIQYTLYADAKVTASTVEGIQAGELPPAGSATPRPGDFSVYKRGDKTFAAAFGPASQDGRIVIAAEVDDTVFAAQRSNQVLLVAATTVLLVTILSPVAVLFARRYTLRPLAKLAAGAARVGAGDYTTVVEVESSDEIGRLAATFNAMAARVRESTDELERQRARLDAAINSLGAVSGALTRTTAGTPALRQAVLDAVAEITGAEVVAMYSGTRSPRVTATRGITRTGARDLLEASLKPATLAAGRTVEVRLDRRAGAHAGWAALVVPMMYQGAPVGALAAYSAEPHEDVDVASLAVLASEASIALENSQLFEREHETVVRLQELDAMKSDFLATIQHELRTPLTAIMGMTDLLEMAWRTWSDAQKLDAIADVQLASKALYDVVETILDYSMLESNKLRLELRPTVLHDAAAAAIDELEPQIRRQGVKVDLRVPARLVAQADHRRLAQVVKALVDNAVKFSPTGGTVEVRGGASNGTVFVSVADKGIGIDPENIGRIFERFYQADSTATRRYGGTGMGLALVKKLVELQNGRVSVASRPGKGSRFTVELGSAPAAYNRPRSR